MDLGGEIGCCFFELGEVLYYYLYVYWVGVGVEGVVEVDYVVFVFEIVLVDGFVVFVG